MLVIVSLILLAIFTFIAAIHFYWAFGGEWGLQSAIPSKSREEKFRPPPIFATIFVGLGLLFFAFVYLVKSTLISSDLAARVVFYMQWVIPVLFLIRAIGDFKYVGFFKRVTDTDFAVADNKWFTPLCLLIAALGMLVNFVD